MSNLKDQIEEPSQKTPPQKKEEEIEDVRGKLENTEARSRNANNCNSFKRTKNNEHEKEDICKKNEDKSRIKTMIRNLSLEGSVWCQNKEGKHPLGM